MILEGTLKGKYVLITNVEEYNAVRETKYRIREGDIGKIVGDRSADVLGRVNVYFATIGECGTAPLVDLNDIIILDFIKSAEDIEKYFTDNTDRLVWQYKKAANF